MGWTIWPSLLHQGLCPGGEEWGPPHSCVRPSQVPWSSVHETLSGSLPISQERRHSIERKPQDHAADLGSARPILRPLGPRTSAFLSLTSLTPQRGVTQSFASGGLPISLPPLKFWKLSPALPELLTYSSFPSPHTRGVGCRPPSKAHSRALGHYYDLIINYYSLVGGGVSSTAQGAPERDGYMSLL